MKRGLKKNQVMIAALAVMIAAAGYLNYTGRLFGTAETTVAQAKVSREQVMAQSKETLQSIIDNKNLSDEQKQDAVDQMVALTKRAELEADIESLMAAKGFSEAVVSIGDDSVDVVVKAEELTDANRAKIEEILTRKTEVSPEGIVITPIHE